MESTHEVDSIWRSLRPWGKYQKFQMFILLTSSGPCAFAILSAVFTGYIPDITCAEVLADNGTEMYKMSDDDHCHLDVYNVNGNVSIFKEQRDCKHFTYSNDLSYAYEWGLVCDRANLAALAQSFALVGQGIGALTMSHLSDRFGRKMVHMVSHIGVLITMTTMAFSQNIYMLLALRVVAGTFQQGMVCTAKVLGLEMFPREIRSNVEAATFLSWSGGVMMLALYGYLFRYIDWRYLQLGLAAFSFFALIEWWILDESPRWLITNGRIDEAKAIFKKVAKWNKVRAATVDDIFSETAGLDKRQAPQEKLSLALNTDKALETKDKLNFEKSVGNGDHKVLDKKRVEKYTVLDILKNPALRTNTFILWYTWIVATGTYYGLTLVSHHLAGDRFLNFFLSGVIEVPSLVLEFYLFNKIGRKKTMILFYATAGVSLVVSTALMTVFSNSSGVYVLATGFSLIGKSAITGSFSTVFLYTPEIYPTNYRNSGLGIASSIARVGGILAPFASNLALIALWIPGAIFGGMCLLVVALALRLPESATHELPSTIAECDTWE